MAERGQPVSELEDYLGRHDLPVQATVELEAGSSFIPTNTPNLVLIDENKRVVGEWLGLLDEDGEAAVVAGLDDLLAAAR